MVVSVLVLMLIIGYAVYNKVSHKNLPAVSVPETSLAYLTINKQDTSETPSFSIDVEYPEFKGLGYSGDNALNALVATSAEREIDSFKKDASRVSSPPGASSSTLSVHYEVREASEAFVSVVFETSAYISGAAHPNDFISTFNYRPDTGKTVSIGDLFVRGKDYLGVLGPMAREKLLGDPQLAGVVTSPWLEQGTAPKLDNFSAFSLTPQGLTLYFNPYQVAAYAAGVLSVTIPFSELRGIADPAGAISLFHP